jgi:AraC family transcriptional regulator
MQVEIVDFCALQVAVLEHRGAMERVNDSVKVFIEWRKNSGLSPKATSRTLGIIYANPDTTPAEQFRFDICGEVEDAVPENAQGIVNKRIPGGRCALLRHLGAYEQIGDSVDHLYREWLPDSGEELRDFPLFFDYLNLITDTPDCDLVTDIYLPLK